MNRRERRAIRRDPSRQTAGSSRSEEDSQSSGARAPSDRERRDSRARGRVPLGPKTPENTSTTPPRELSNAEAVSGFLPQNGASEPTNVVNGEQIPSASAPSLSAGLPWSPQRLEYASPSVGNTSPSSEQMILVPRSEFITGSRSQEENGDPGQQILKEIRPNNGQQS